MRRIVMRVGLGLAAFCVGVTGVVVATDEPARASETVVVAPAAVVTCLATGPYRAPEPGSAGLPAGTVLCPTGPVTVSQPGAVLDGWDVRGGVEVTAPGVVIRRSRITGDGRVAMGVHTSGAGTVRVEDTTLTGDFPQAAIGDERWTAERIEIVGVTHDGARLGDGARLRNSVLRDFAPAPGATPDGLVLRGDDVLVEDNRVEPGPDTGSAVRVEGAADGGSVVLRGNVLGGGRYTVHEDPADGPPAQLRITGNRFRRADVSVPLRVSPRADLSDNVFVDGGLLPGR